MTGTKMRRMARAKPFLRVSPEVKRAREVLAMLTPEARAVMSRMKGGETVLSLPELAMTIEPNLPGLLVSARAEGEDAWEARSRRFDPARTTENLVLDDQQRANFHARARQEAALSKQAKEPLEQRLLPDGGLLPALGDHPSWGLSLQRARAVIVELETLGLLIAVEVRGASVSEKWTPTTEGRRVCGQLSVNEWRKPGRTSP